MQSQWFCKENVSSIHSTYTITDNYTLYGLQLDVQSTAQMYSPQHRHTYSPQHRCTVHSTDIHTVHSTDVQSTAQTYSPQHRCTVHSTDVQSTAQTYSPQHRCTVPSTDVQSPAQMYSPQYAPTSTYVHSPMYTHMTRSWIPSFLIPAQISLRPSLLCWDAASVNRKTFKSPNFFFPSTAFISTSIDTTSASTTEKVLRSCDHHVITKCNT